MAKINFSQKLRVVLYIKNIFLILLFVFFSARIVLADESSSTFERYPSGQIKSEIVTKGAEKDSTTTFFENGQKETELLFANGKRSIYSEWFESGNKKEQIDYKDGEPIKMMVWNSKGSLDSTSIFAADGIRTDTFFYSSGNRKSVQSSRGKKPVGVWTKWSDDGKKLSEKSYEEREPADVLSDEFVY